MNSDIHLLPSRDAEPIQFDWGHLTWFASREAGNSQEMTVGRCVLNAGCANPRHKHPNCSEILVVIRGSIRHTGPAGKDIVMTAGDTVAVPPNVWHNATNIGDTEAILFIAFTSADRETIGE